MVNTRGKSKTATPNKTSESKEVAEIAEVEGRASHSLMGKNKTDSPNKSSEANEVAENEEAEGQASHSLAVETEALNGDGQFEGKVKIPVEETGTEGYEEMPGEEESVKAKAENDDWKLNMDRDDYKLEFEPMPSPDDQDDQDDQMWEDDEEPSEEDNEENVTDEDEVSDEDSVKEDDDVDKVIAEEDDDAEDEVSAEEEDHGKDEVSIDKTTEVAVGDEKKAKEDGGEAKPKEDGKDVKEHDNGKVEEGLKDDKNSNKKIRKKKLKVAVPNKVDSKDKAESSQKSKGKKRVESMGMIFMCSSKTRSDCFQYKVLGLPESKKDIVEKIYSGMRLFLYDIDLKMMHGIFKAAGPGGFNLEPKAFKSQFPSQVRFSVLDDCLPLPEEKFKKVIKGNYFSKNKFDCQLKAEQVKQLCKLFVSSSKDHLPKKVRGPRKVNKAENPNPVGQETSRRRRLGDKRRHPAPEEEEPRLRERTRKRPRKDITSPRRRPLPPRKDITSPRRRPLPPRKLIISPRRQPLPAPVSSYAYERTSNVDAYSRRDQYSYRDRRDLSPVTYREVVDPAPVIRRDPYLERDYPYRDGRDLYVESRDPYRDGRDAYVRRHPDPYIDRPASYLERRDLDIGSSYRDGRASYLERRDPYRDSAYSVPYSSEYRRDLPPLSDSRDAYRDDQGGEYRSSVRREEVLERGGGLHPLAVETRYRPELYASTRQLPSYADPIYSSSAEYSSRAGLAREYRL